MEDTSEEVENGWLRRFPRMKYCRFICITLIACGAAYTHAVYVSALHENHLHFSHLSRLEREMTLHSEMGFYYSYFKTVVEERPFLAAISKLMHDRTVEYPNEVNAFNRFNIHPEVLLGALYRYLEPWLAPHRTCHVVCRGPGRARVRSCAGDGEPVVFYLHAVWLLAGATTAALFVYGTILSNTVWGGVFSLAWYWRLHPDCTRVQWAPNLRENFAHPLLLAQAALLTAGLRARRSASLSLQVSLLVTTALALVCWQFAQFALLSQTAILFLMQQARVVPLRALALYLHAQFCALHAAALLLHGNDMLKSSLYAAFFLVLSAYCLLFGAFRLKIETRLDLFVECWLVLLRISIVVCVSFWLKRLISDFLNVDEDSHVWDILYSKLNSDYKTFHTMIYTCSAVFDFLPLETWKELVFSGLIPVTLIVTFNAVYFWYRSARENLSCPPPVGKKTRTGQESTESDEDSGIENGPESKMTDERSKMADLNEVEEKVCEEPDRLMRLVRGAAVEPGACYALCQLLVYAALAALVARLKLLWVPHMCVVAALLMDASLLPPWRWLRTWRRVLLVPLLLLLVSGIVRTVREETSHIGEFSDPPQEELLSWIVSGDGHASHASHASHARSHAVYAGPAPLMAAVLLSTRRAIVNHPHYEHREARERMYAVYQTYSRVSPSELYRALGQLRVTHLVLDKTYCRGYSNRGCSWDRIWDRVDPARRGRPQLCQLLQRAPVDHFYTLFDNSRYTVFKLHDYSLRYSPRALDS